MFTGKKEIYRPPEFVALLKIFRHPIFGGQPPSQSGMAHGFLGGLRGSVHITIEGRAQDGFVLGLRSCIRASRRTLLSCFLG